MSSNSNTDGSNTWTHDDGSTTGGSTTEDQTTEAGDTNPDGQPDNSGEGQTDGDSDTTDTSGAPPPGARPSVQQVAQELKDAFASHHDTGPHDVLKDAVAKVEATVHAAFPLVHGLSLDEGNHFADFIKAAQSPVQSGLMSALHPADANALHPVDASSAGHDVGLHTVDDLHAAVHAVPVAVHDSAAGHIAAPVSVEALWHH
jgi:hypothetical protein